MFHFSKFWSSNCQFEQFEPLVCWPLPLLNIGILPLISLKIALLLGVFQTYTGFLAPKQNHLPSWDSFIPLNERNIFIRYLDAKDFPKSWWWARAILWILLGPLLVTAVDYMPLMVLSLHSFFPFNFPNCCVLLF